MEWACAVRTQHHRSTLNANVHPHELSATSLSKTMTERERTRFCEFPWFIAICSPDYHLFDSKSKLSREIFWKNENNIENGYSISSTKSYGFASPSIILFAISVASAHCSTSTSVVVDWFHYDCQVDIVSLEYVNSHRFNQTFFSFLLMLLLLHCCWINTFPRIKSFNNNHAECR